VASEQRPPPPPLEGNDLIITVSITAAWVVALIVLLIIRDQLPSADHWWIWVPVCGACQGVFGMFYVPYLKKSRSRAAARRAQQGQPG
jgi:H+/Cl- antiporter ClcA